MFRVKEPLTEEEKTCYAFYAKFNDDAKFTFTKEQQKEIRDKFYSSFQPVYDKWIQVRENFLHERRVMIIDEIFSKMKFTFKISPAEYDAVKRRAVSALHKGIISDFNGPDATRKGFTDYTAGLLAIEIYTHSINY